MDISKTYSAYCKVCIDAVNDDNLFNSFKRNNDYCEILEHQIKHLGQTYFDYIIQEHPYILNNLPNDNIGNPVKYEYGNFLLNPTTLRYIYTYLDIKKYFGHKLHNSTIVEVGGGYGGQCVILDKFYDVGIYIIYDLEPACKLAEKYLNKAGVKALVKTKSELVDSAEGYDFGISNYAFTELDRDVQEKYIDFVFSNCDRGYLTLNTEQGLSYQEVKDRIPGSELVPGIFKGEYVLIWGD